MTSIEKSKSFKKWRDDLEERLAWYLFNNPEPDEEKRKLLEAPWATGQPNQTETR